MSIFAERHASKCRCCPHGHSLGPPGKNDGNASAEAARPPTAAHWPLAGWLVGCTALATTVATSLFKRMMPTLNTPPLAHVSPPLGNKNSQNLVDRSTTNRAFSDHSCAILTHANVTTGIDGRHLRFGKAYDTLWPATL